MKKLHLVLVLMLLIGIALIARPVAAQLSFGGIYTPIAVCNSGHTLAMVAPYGMFMFTRPPLIGLPYVLGLAALAPVPCIVGIVPIGSGFQVLLSN